MKQSPFEDIIEERRIDKKEAKSFISNQQEDFEESKHHQRKVSHETVHEMKKDDELEKSGGIQAGEDDDQQLGKDDDETDIDCKSEYSSQQQVVGRSRSGRFHRFAEMLGRGAYKNVYRGLDMDTGREVAWSIINVSQLHKSDKARINSEIKIIRELEHKNIIHFICAWIDKEKDQINIITEMITGGSLRQYLKKICDPKLKVIK